MSYLGHLDQFILDIRRASGLDEIFTCLTRQLSRIGFEHYTYEVTWPHLGNSTNFFVSTYPSEWISRYVERRYCSDDVVCRYMFGRIRPFLWTEATKALRVTRRQRLVLDEGGDFGIKAGASIPLYGPDTIRAQLSVANGEEDEEFAKLFASSRHELHLTATYAHEKIVETGLPNVPRLPRRLTPREVEVMTWTAHGKTAWEISEILSVSEQTVKDHIENVCRKLSVNNKTHATALALIQGFIAL